MEIRNLGLACYNGGRFQSPPTWIVIHYTGNANTTANAEALYMAKKKRKCSTHFIIDKKEIISCVPENIIAWHVGDGSVKQPLKDRKLSLDELIEYGDRPDWRYALAARNHKIWRKNKEFRGNLSSLGVDLCAEKKNPRRTDATDDDWFIPDETMDKAIELVSSLMKKYSIDISHIIRHADATGKPCPRPFVSLSGDKKVVSDFYDNVWNIFLDKLKSRINSEMD